MSSRSTPTAAPATRSDQQVAAAGASAARDVDRAIEGTTTTTTRTVTDPETGKSTTWLTEITQVQRHWSQLPLWGKRALMAFGVGMCADMTLSAYRDATKALFDDRKYDHRFAWRKSAPEEIQMREWNCVTKALSENNFWRFLASFGWPSRLLSGATAPIVLWLNKVPEPSQPAKDADSGPSSAAPTPAAPAAPGNALAASSTVSTATTAPAAPAASTGDAADKSSDTLNRAWAPGFRG